MFVHAVSGVRGSWTSAPHSWHAAAVCVLIACVTVPAAADPHPQLVQWCERLSARLPGISAENCRNSQLTLTGAASLKGFPILARQIPATNRADVADRPVRILLIGGIHGDELTSSSIVFKWLQFMQMAEAREFHWNVVPILNPDGLLARKPSRLNANGIDLNRNFPTPGWQQDAPRYWVKRTGSDPRRFPGKAPLSEPESRWLNDEMERFRPQVIISVHAPFGVLDFDGPVEPPRRFGRLRLNQVGVYPGSLGNYSGLHKKVPVITIELPNARAMPSDAETRRIWKDMLSWIKGNVPKQQETTGTQLVSLPAPPDSKKSGPSKNQTYQPQDGKLDVWSRMSAWMRRTFF
ncbi:MAG: murein peptide amidase A [Burkholderiales bacterium RIFCSPLOWO2_02_FULL_57_36]|nr:MAG: murein peptide amidase A [Burkholderiales bacterium RIFCSPLOWO2_02_FULL_57_36]